MKCAIIELSTAHFECVYSPVLFLKLGGHTVELCCSTAAGLQINNLKEQLSTVLFDLHHRSTLKRWKELFRLRRYLIENRFDVILLNTAQGKAARNLVCLLLPKRIRIVGILHDTAKFSRSFTQRLIHQHIAHYFLLNDYLLASVPSQFTARSSSMYSIFFPKFSQLPILKPEGEIWVLIPGQLEYKRRDYLGLLEVLKLLPELTIKFILAGNAYHPQGDGPDFEQRIRSAHLEERFKLFKSFIADNHLHQYAIQCDAVMPLIHSNYPSFSQYQKHQITGAFNLAFAYQKPLLCDAGFQGYQDFDENAIFYNLDQLSDILQNIQNLIHQGNKRSYQQEKWSFDYQQSHFIQKLLGNQMKD